MCPLRLIYTKIKIRPLQNGVEIRFKLRQLALRISIYATASVLAQSQISTQFCSGLLIYERKLFIKTRAAALDHLCHGIARDARLKSISNYLPKNFYLIAEIAITRCVIAISDIK